MSQNNGLRLPKLVACDLDGTLLNEKQQIDPVNKVAVAKLRAQGSRFVLASGRIAQQMLPFYEELGLDEPIIACNGAHVLIPGGKTIFSRTIKPSMAADIVALAEAMRVTCLVYFEEGVHITYLDHWSEFANRHITEGSVAIEFSDKKDVLGRAPFKINLSAPEERLTRTLGALRTTYGGALNTWRFDGEHMEVMPASIDKKVGLEVVARHYGLAAADCLAVGDGDNDAGMLEWAGLGISMHHGTPKAKEACNLVASASKPGVNFAIGLEEALKQFGKP